MDNGRTTEGEWTARERNKDHAKQSRETSRTLEGIGVTDGS